MIVTRRERESRCRVFVCFPPKYYEATTDQCPHCQIIYFPSRDTLLDSDYVTCFSLSPYFSRERSSITSELSSQEEDQSVALNEFKSRAECKTVQAWRRISEAFTSHPLEGAPVLLACI